MLQSLLADLMVISPEYVVMFGAPELQRLRPRRFLTVRQGGRSQLLQV
jgi:hypothetical protein